MLIEIKNYFFAYFLDFVLFGIFATLFASIIFGSIYYYSHKAVLKRSVMEKKVLSKSLAHHLPELQQVATNYKYFKN